MNKPNKLDRYFNAAKNSGAEFTQSELQRIVESSSEGNERSFNFTSTNNWKRTLFMITLGLTIVSGIAGSLLWLGLPASTPPLKTMVSINAPETKSDKQTQNNQSPKESTLISKVNSTKEVEQKTKAETSKNTKNLNIDGITTISLSKEELANLEITLGKDCGITAYNGFLTGTYYNANKMSSHEGSTNTNSANSINMKAHTVWQMPSSEKVIHKIHPILSTSSNGQILSDALGSRLQNETKSLETNTQEKSAFDLNGSNSIKKAKITVYIYPNDTSTTEEDIQQAMSDTSEYFTEFKRLTTEDVVRMKKETEDRHNKIYEYLKLNKLIAIKANADCADNTVIFWFEPTVDFINSLPTRFQADLTNQFIKKEIAQQETRDANKENAKTGCEYTDICRATSGAVIESSIFPNPANESASLRFELTEQRKCTFSLHDLSGVYIKELTNESTLGKGEHTITMDIQNVKAGVYLLSMITDKNERIAQRLIIKK